MTDIKQTTSEFMQSLFDTATEMNAGHMQVSMERCAKFNGASFIFIVCTDNKSYAHVSEHLSNLPDIE
jgi:hypothetical protein